MANVTTNNLPDADALGWDTRTQLTSPANGELVVSNNAGTSFFELVAAAANTLELRNGTNAQAMYVYNTFADASNYERLGLYVSGSEFYLSSQRAGTGQHRALNLEAPNADLKLRAYGRTGITVGSSFRVLFDSTLEPTFDNVPAIGTNSKRWATIHTGSGVSMSETTAPTAVADRAILFAQDNGSGKTRLMVQFPSGSPVQIAIEP